MKERKLEMDQDKRKWWIDKNTTFSSPEERIARELCKSKGIDPDKITTGLGRLADSKFEYPLWKAWALDVSFVLKEYNLLENCYE